MTPSPDLSGTGLATPEALLAAASSTPEASPPAVDRGQRPLLPPDGGTGISSPADAGGSQPRSARDVRVSRGRHRMLPAESPAARGGQQREQPPNPLREWQARQGAEFAIMDTDGGHLLGSCGLVRLNQADLVGEVGYWLAPHARPATSTRW